MTIRAFHEYTPVLAKGVFIDPSAVIIGNVCLGQDCSVWPQAVIRGDMHSISIGERSNIQDGAILHITHAGPYNPEGWPLVIGDDVTVGHRALLHGCALGNRILIGNGAIVMDGTVIEDEVIVGANSLVPAGKRLDSGYLYMGSPCKKTRPLSEKEKAFFIYSSANYVKLKNQHLDTFIDHN